MVSKVMRCAVDMNREHHIWLKILVACIVECLENFKGMRKQDHYVRRQLKDIYRTEFCQNYGRILVWIHLLPTIIHFKKGQR